LIGKLIYLTVTQPDIPFVAGVLSRYIYIVHISSITMMLVVS